MVFCLSFFMTANTGARAQVAVFDMINEALQRFSDANRAAEYASSAETAMATLTNLKTTYDEISKQTQNWSWMVDAADFLKTTTKYANAAKELEWTTKSYLNTIDMYNRMINYGYMSVPEGIRTTERLSAALLELVKEYKFTMGYVLTNTNKSMTAAEKLTQLDSLIKRFGRERLMAKSLMRDAYDKLEQDAIADRLAASKKNAIVKSDNDTYLLPSQYKNGITNPSYQQAVKTSINKTQSEVTNDIKTRYFSSSSAKSKQEVSDVVHSEISPMKSPLYDFVRIVIAVMSLFYIGFNLIRVMKGEGQSKDALLKAILGLLFGLAALSILQSFFGTGSLL